MRVGDRGAISHLSTEATRRNGRSGAMHPDLQALLGLSRLAVDAVTGVTDIVEDIHRTIASVRMPIGASAPGRARGIAGLVYGSVRGIARLAGYGIEAAMIAGSPLLGRSGDEATLRHAASLSALNGVLGDYLHATGNPLTIPMQWRIGGQTVGLDRSLDGMLPQASGRIVILLHGLCMSDLQWLRHDHDHGVALARDLDCTAVYLNYNSGRQIAGNGRELSELIEQLIRRWPVEVTDLSIIGHSMGGLLARSACDHAEATDHDWRRHLQRMIFLGTPHHGAPLERAGRWFERTLAISPYTAPFARLGGIRSAGIQDLRHGAVRDAGGNATGPCLPLPADVRCFAIAASRARQDKGDATIEGKAGDGLVPVKSAWGLHEDDLRTLSIPPTHRALFHGLNHFDLLSNSDVYAKLRQWMAE